MGKYKFATFGGGCFWCTEAIFSKLNGIISTVSGYSGGEKENPTYNEVCAGTTGHAEVIHIEYNADIINYSELLEVFFKTHNPTTLNRQGLDHGTQYRSVIFYHDSEQKNTADNIIEELNNAGIWDSPIVTEVANFDKFYKAEDYHKNYFENNKKQPYCEITIMPKIEKFKNLFSDKLK
jgi:peptide-methionine (S)-S-oxide reductase